MSRVAANGKLVKHHSFTPLGKEVRRLLRLRGNVSQAGLARWLGISYHNLLDLMAGSYWDGGALKAYSDEYPPMRALKLWVKQGFYRPLRPKDAE